jgi:hypothetical protein
LKRQFWKEQRGRYQHRYRAGREKKCGHNPYRNWPWHRLHDSTQLTEPSGRELRKVGQ